MESLLPLLIFGFIAYSWIKKISDFTNKQQTKVGGEKVHDPQELIKQFFAGQSGPKFNIPKQQSLSLTESNSDDLFSEDKWRRQLLLVSLTIGAIYLLYLILI